METGSFHLSVERDRSGRPKGHIYGNSSPNFFFDSSGIEYFLFILVVSSSAAKALSVFPGFCFVTDETPNCSSLLKAHNSSLTCSEQCFTQCVFITAPWIC